MDHASDPAAGAKVQAVLSCLTMLKIIHQEGAPSLSPPVSTPPPALQSHADTVCE
ncbi:MAG: hypothetical protein HY006_00445 [Candidatus Sungbacteria bacterium]|nr:hypothetical protein [Candidatus Sungbacteria bacterium]